MSGLASDVEGNGESESFGIGIPSPIKGISVDGFSFLTDVLVESASILNWVNSFSSASASEAEMRGISVTLLKILLNWVLTGDDGVSLPLSPGEAGGSLWMIVGDDGG